METRLAHWLAGTAEGAEAEAILRRCVHCGFCTATCPTYQLLGDELDGPRGRIYLIKQVVEGRAPGASTQGHLDRCLTCRSCESTCPSGVEYARLLDIGRELVDRQVRRPLAQRLLRFALREAIARRWPFAVALRAGQWLRPLLPPRLRSRVPQHRAALGWPARTHARKVVLPAGCAQPALMPNVDAATARVLDRLGVQALRAPDSGCCGAVRHHLGDPGGALAQARRNVDAWWPLLEAGAEAILVNASGCGAMVKEYGRLLRADPAYAQRALRVAAAARDPAEWLPAQLEGSLDALRVRVTGSDAAARVAFQSPCSLQHGQRVRGAVEQLLARLGAEPLPVADAHLCCGSAGTWSILEPGLAAELRARKLAALQARAPAAILSANVGCIAHLQAGTRTPVRHWVEWLDEAMAETSG